MTRTDMANLFNRHENDKGQWFWNITDDNGRIIADSGEGYDNSANLERGIENVIEEFVKAYESDADGEGTF